MSDFKTDWGNTTANLVSDLADVREVVVKVDTYDTNTGSATVSRAIKDLSAVMVDYQKQFDNLLCDLQDTIDSRAQSWDSQNREACGGEYR